MFFFNLEQNLVSKLTLFPNIFTGSKVMFYYGTNAKFKDLDFQLYQASPEIMLNILKDLNPSKAAGINNRSDIFQKDGPGILARSISQLCNFSVKLISYLKVATLKKIKILFKEDSELILKTTDLFYYLHYCGNYEKDYLKQNTVIFE